LIDLGAIINVMTKETMLKLKLQGDLRKNTTFLQLVDKSILAIEGIIKDGTVSIES